MRGWAGGLALTALAACAGSAPRGLPRDAVPTAWETTRTSSLAVTSTGAAWWEAFGDPVLDRLIARAEVRNLDLRIADARLQEARALRSGATAELWPEVDGSAAVSVSRSKRPDAKPRDFQLGLNVSWVPDLFGRVRSEARASEADERSLRADREAVQLLLTAEVAETYVEYRLRRVQHALSLRTAEAQEATLRITRARFGQGIASRFDVERAVAALAITRSRIPEADTLAAAARHRLALLLAEPSDVVTQALDGDRPLPDSDPKRILQSPAQVVARRPDVRAAEWRFLAALARKDGAEALRYPTLDLAGLIGLESPDLTELFNPASLIWSIGAGLLAPLLDFGRIRAKIDVADARQQQAYLEYERTVRTALEEAQTAIISYAQGVLRQGELWTAVVSARKAAQLARRQYREGTLSLLEVLDAERSLNDAELSWSQASADVSVRLITIHRTMGG